MLTLNRLHLEDNQVDSDETEEGVLSNFLDEDSKIVTDFLIKTDKTIYHKTDGENENYKFLHSIMWISK